MRILLYFFIVILLFFFQGFPVIFTTCTPLITRTPQRRLLFRNKKNNSGWSEGENFFGGKETKQERESREK